MKYTLLLGFGVVSAVLAYLYFMQQKQEKKLQFLIERFNQIEKQHINSNDDEHNQVEHFEHIVPSQDQTENQDNLFISSTYTLPDKPRTLSNDSNGPKTPNVSESSRDKDEQSIDDIEREINQLKEELGEFYDEAVEVIHDEPLYTQSIFMSIERNLNPLYNNILSTNDLQNKSSTKIEVCSENEHDENNKEYKKLDVIHEKSNEIENIDDKQTENDNIIVDNKSNNAKMEFLTTDNNDNNILNYINQHMEATPNDNKSNKTTLKNNLSQFEDLDDIEHIENNELDSYINQVIENHDIELEQHLETLSQTSLTDITKIENNNLEVKVDVIANTWKLSDLKEICKSNGLSQKGNKHELIKRILEHIPDVFENPKNDFENKSKTTLLN